jgi:farnesol dehydrogenase
MIYFVTGSTGFIGLNLSKKLAEQGHQVKALVRSEEKGKLLQHPGITKVYASLSDYEVLDKAIKGADGIYHLAAYAQPYSRDKYRYNELNAASTKKIFELAEKHKVRRVVFTSTAGTFGPSFSKPVDEETVRKIDFLNEYESTKFIAEKIAKDYALKGVDIVIVHPTRVFGPGIISKSNAVTLMIKNYIKGLWRIIPGDGSKTGNYVFVDDVVDGHILAMLKGKKGHQYLLGGDNLSYTDFFKLVKSVSHKNYTLVKIPLWILKAFAYVQMKVAVLFHKMPLLPPKWVNKYLYNWSVSSEKANKELGYKPLTAAEGFRKTIKWLKQENNGK